MRGITAGTASGGGQRAEGVEKLLGAGLGEIGRMYAARQAGAAPVPTGTPAEMILGGQPAIALAAAEPDIAGPALGPNPTPLPTLGSETELDRLQVCARRNSPAITTEGCSAPAAMRLSAPATSDGSRKSSSPKPKGCCARPASTAVRF